MKAFDFVDIAVLDEEGNRLGANCVGRLVANSPCTMKCYKNDQKGTAIFFVTDSEGQVWGDMAVFGYIDKKGLVYMRNRIIRNDHGIPPFKIADEVFRCKEIMSCEVVQTEDQYVAHVEFMPMHKHKTEETLKKALCHIRNEFGEEIADKVLFRIHSGANSFQLTSSGKRNIRALVEEGTANCVNY